MEGLSLLFNLPENLPMPSCLTWLGLTEKLAVDTGVAVTTDGSDFGTPYDLAANCVQ